MDNTAAPQKQHLWLHKLVGEWHYETADASCSHGTESVRSLGGLWVLCEGRGKMPDGSDSSTLMTLGFDPQKGRYTGTWIGSMMTWLWLYDGSLDAAEKVLTLESQGPDFDGKGGLASYRDVIAWHDDDHRVLTAHVQGGNGEWRQFMTVNYRRVK